MATDTQGDIHFENDMGKYEGNAGLSDTTLNFVSGRSVTDSWATSLGRAIHSTERLERNGDISGHIRVMVYSYVIRFKVRSIRKRECDHLARHKYG